MKTDATPLIWATILNNAEVAQALLDAKADPASRTEKKMFGPGQACREVRPGRGAVGPRRVLKLRVVYVKSYVIRQL